MENGSEGTYLVCYEFCNEYIVMFLKLYNCLNDIMKGRVAAALAATNGDP